MPCIYIQTNIGKENLERVLEALKASNDEYGRMAKMTEVFFGQQLDPINKAHILLIRVLGL
jgi:hypothetical protein